MASHSAAGTDDSLSVFSAQVSEPDPGTDLVQRRIGRPLRHAVACCSLVSNALTHSDASLSVGDQLFLESRVAFERTKTLGRALSNLSRLSPTVRAFAMYASQPLSQWTLQHSLQSGPAPYLGRTFADWIALALPGALIR
jgi:hypothetical protein